MAAGRYHGRLSAKERDAMQSAFMHDNYKVLVATKAFGVGIDKPNIRFVYHYEFPDSLETYYQEAGRAGRDGEPAQAALFYRLEDKRIQRFFLAGRYPRLDEAQRVYSASASASTLDEIAARASISKRRAQVILHMLREAGLASRNRELHVAVAAGSSAQLEKMLGDYEARATTDTDRLDEMMHYAESPQCRKQLLRIYFAEDPGAPCGSCDNCTEPATTRLASPQHTSHDTVIQMNALTSPTVTTAPESLPQPDPDEIRKGDSIEHIGASVKAKCSTPTDRTWSPALRSQGQRRCGQPTCGASAETRFQAALQLNFVGEASNRKLATVHF